MKRGRVFPFIFFLLAITNLYAQENIGSKPKKWYSPDFVVMQYAGSIGFLSAGGGYSIFKDKATVDLLFGYIPAFAGGLPLETFTLKFTGTPWRIPVGKGTTLYPFTAGTYFCYTAGHEFSSELPSWYPNGYYWWSEAVRVNIFIGGSADRITPHFKPVSKINLYYEIGTNEIKFVSYVQNTHALSFVDILHAGIGVRAYFGK